LIDSEKCGIIINRHYREIYNYCYAKTNYRKHSAEDCTQEVFLIFFKKYKSLESDENIRIWLYRTADNVIRNYNRKFAVSDISISDVEEELRDFSEVSSFEEKESILDSLSDEEKRIVSVYYGSSYGDKKSASKILGIPLPSLYQKIHKIKKKLKKKTSE